MRFLEWILFYFGSNFTEICSQRSNQQFASIGSDNGLAPNRRQAIIWTNDGLVYWRICVTWSGCFQTAPGGVRCYLFPSNLTVFMWFIRAVLCITLGHIWLYSYTGTVLYFFIQSTLWQLSIRSGASKQILNITLTSQERRGVSDHRQLDRMFNHLFRLTSCKPSKPTLLCQGSPPVTGGFPPQAASNAESVSI